MPMSCHLTKADYETIKGHLTMRQVAEHYGYPADSKGWCLCPFHKDSHPSMLLYPDGRGFYCFSCGAGGDAVSFVARLFGLRNAQAARQLAEDFHIPVDLDGGSYRERRERMKRYREQKRIEKWAQDTGIWLNIYRQLLCEAVRDWGSPHFAEALQELSIVDYRIQCLADHPESYYQDGKAVKKIAEIRNRIDRWYEGSGPIKAISG